MKSRCALLVLLVFCSFAVTADSTADELNRLRDKLIQVVPKELKTLMPTEAGEIAAGRDTAASVFALAPPVDNPALQRYVNLVGRWIASQSERPDLPWRFVVIDAADLNAFAVPGGYVLITNGLYASLTDTAELAGVLAHEIAHVVARHHLQATISSQLIAEGARRAGEALGSDPNKLTNNLLGSGASLLSRTLDQKSEFEADRMAVVLASRAGYDPYGLPAVLTRLAQLPQLDDRVALLFKTHPQPKARLHQLGSAMGDQLLQYGESGQSGKRLPVFPVPWFPRVLE